MVFPPRDPDAAHRPDGFGCGLCPAKQTFGLPRSAQDDTAKKREANADAESRAASLKMTAWGGGRIISSLQL